MATFTKVLLLQAGEMRKGEEKQLNIDYEKEEGGWARGEGGVAPVGLSPTHQCHGWSLGGIGKKAGPNWTQLLLPLLVRRW